MYVYLFTQTNLGNTWSQQLLRFLPSFDILIVVFSLARKHMKRVGEKIHSILTCASMKMAIIAINSLSWWIHSIIYKINLKNFLSNRRHKKCLNYFLPPHFLDFYFKSFVASIKSTTSVVFFNDPIYESSDQKTYSYFKRKKNEALVLFGILFREPKILISKSVPFFKTVCIVLSHGRFQNCCSRSTLHV